MLKAWRAICVAVAAAWGLVFLRWFSAYYVPERQWPSELTNWAINLAEWAVPPLVLYWFGLAMARAYRGIANLRRA